MLLPAGSLALLFCSSLPFLRRSRRPDSRHDPHWRPRRAVSGEAVRRPGRQVLAPVDAVQLLGAKFAPNADGTVTVTAANGRRINVPYTLVQGRYCVPFQKVAQALGGTADWQPATATLTVRAKLEMVRQDADALTIYTSYPVYYSVKRIDNPERLYVDLFGLDLATTPGQHSQHERQRHPHPQRADRLSDGADHD